MTQGINSQEELKESVKSTVLRPLADKFQELTRQIDSGKYRLPDTVNEAELVTENYIEQAWSRIAKIIEAEKLALLVKLEDKKFTWALDENNSYEWVEIKHIRALRQSIKEKSE